MDSDEGYLRVTGGRVWYKTVGSGGVPLLTLHGGPGFCHDYLCALEDLASERPVIFFDQLGCGKSDRPSDTSLWTVDFFVNQIDEVRQALSLDDTHLLGQSWGGMLAMQYVLDRRPKLRSLVVANSPASMPRFIEDNMRLKEELPPEVRETIDWHEERGYTDCPEYQGAIAFWFRRHICRMRPWPEGLEQSFAGLGQEVYAAMIGPSEFRVTGNLREWDVTDRLSDIRLPTLFVAGQHDEIRPSHVFDMHTRVTGSDYVLYEDSAHFPFEEERGRFMADLASFLARAERRTEKESIQ